MIAPPTADGQPDGQAAELVEALPGIAGSYVDLDDHRPRPNGPAAVANGTQARAWANPGDWTRTLFLHHDQTYFT